MVRGAVRLNKERVMWRVKDLPHGLVGCACSCVAPVPVRRAGV